MYKDLPSTIAPHEKFGLPGETGTQNYRDVVTDHSKLLIRTIIKYTWPGGLEEKCCESFYEPQPQVFTAENCCPAIDIP